MVIALAGNLLDDAHRAAKAMENIIAGSGDAADLPKVEAFLAVAAADPVLFNAFADKFRGATKVWHPSEVAALLRRAPTSPTSPTLTRLQQMKKVPNIDPVKVGAQMNNLATGACSGAELLLMMQQLPGVLADPFAFEAMKSAMSERCLKVENGPAATAAAVVQICNDGVGDPATLKLKRLLAKELSKPRP